MNNDRRMDRKELIDTLYPEYSAREFFGRALAAYHSTSTETQPANKVPSGDSSGAFMRALADTCSMSEIREAETRVKEACKESKEIGQRVLNGYIQIGVLEGPLEKYAGELAS